MPWPGCSWPSGRRLVGQWLGVPVDGLDDLAAVVFEELASFPLEGPA